MSTLTLDSEPASTDITPPPRRWGRRFRLFLMYAGSIGWLLFKMFFFGFLYVYLISDGLRMLIPTLGQKLYKLPGLASLRSFEETHKLDLAVFFAAVLFVAVTMIWMYVIEAWLFPNRELGYDDVDHGRYRSFVFTLGIVILGSDLFLFYIAMLSVGWKGAYFSLSALLATLAYGACVVAVNFISVMFTYEFESVKKS